VSRLSTIPLNFAYQDITAFADLPLCCSVLQRVAACYEALQCVLVCSRVLQYVAMCCNVVQCVAFNIHV